MHRHTRQIHQHWKEKLKTIKNPIKAKFLKKYLILILQKLKLL
jgi:hypothetical protein